MWSIRPHMLLSTYSTITTEKVLRRNSKNTIFFFQYKSVVHGVLDYYLCRKDVNPPAQIYVSKNLIVTTQDVGFSPFIQNNQRGRKDKCLFKCSLSLKIFSSLFFLSTPMTVTGCIYFVSPSERQSIHICFFVRK